MQVNIVDFPETKIAALSHKGSPLLINDTIAQFIKWRLENGLQLGQHLNYAILYNDPDTTLPDDYQVDICLSISHDISENTYGIVNKIIPAGRCAVVRHFGARENISSARYLYHQWLPTSGETLRAFPLFMHLVNVGSNIPVQDMITYVYLPLQGLNPIKCIIH